MRNNTVFAILFPVVAVVFFLGIVNLFHIRFQNGDIYPVYSSLRSDPLGTKVMYEALEHIQGVSADRNYYPLYKIRHDPETTYLFLGMHTMDLDLFTKKDAEALDSMITEGGRLVMTFVPAGKAQMKCATGKKEACDTVSGKGQDTDDVNEKTDEKTVTGHDDDGPLSHADLGERWGVEFAFHDSAGVSDGTGDSESVLMADGYDLPDTMSWHSHSYFRIHDNEWNEIYAVEGRPVLIERDFGRGKIILSSDTYFASNEAMLKERHPDLLSWIIGKNRKALFDETHHGIVEQPNIAALARKYRLHGLFAGFLVLAALFIWKNSTSFMPPDKDREEENIHVHIKDYLSGLVNLLRRNIQSSEIVDVCFREWTKTGGPRRHGAHDLNQIKEILMQDRQTPVNRRNVLKSYTSIRQILDKRRHL
jgi:hypothetical protein